MKYSKKTSHQLKEKIYITLIKIYFNRYDILSNTLINVKKNYITLIKIYYSAKKKYINKLKTQIK